MERQSATGSAYSPLMTPRLVIATTVSVTIPRTPAIKLDTQYRPARAANNRAICGRSEAFVLIAPSLLRSDDYLLAPQWQPRSSEQQFPGSANLPSGPMHVWVMAHQKSPSSERGTVGSGSDQMYWLFQCSAEHSPGRSVLNLSGTLIMLHLLLPHHAQQRRALGTLLPSEWPASLLHGPDGFCARCVPGSWLLRLRLVRPGLPWLA